MIHIFQLLWHLVAAQHLVPLSGFVVICTICPSPGLTSGSCSTFSSSSPSGPPSSLAARVAASLQEAVWSLKEAFCPCWLPAGLFKTGVLFFLEVVSLLVPLSFFFAFILFIAFMAFMAFGDWLAAFGFAFVFFLRVFCLCFGPWHCSIGVCPCRCCRSCCIRLFPRIYSFISTFHL